MKKNQIKTNLQLLLRKFTEAAITDIWYQGTRVYTPTYHAVSKAIYIALDTGDVYCCKPGDELGLKIAYGITVKKMLFWDREQRQLTNLVRVSDFEEWKLVLERPLLSAKVNWNYKNNIMAFRGTHLQEGDYPQSIEFAYNDHFPFFITTTKVWNDSYFTKASHHLTVFFNPKTKEAYDRKSE